MVSRKVNVQKGANIIVLKDLGMLNTGTYVLEINNGKNRTIKKLMKN